jgi:NADH/F420H2 dehydrogenase subunit C
MSEEKKENGSAPASKPAAPAAEAAPPPPPPVGEVGKALEGAKIPFTSLGEDGMGIEMIDMAPDSLLRAGEFIRDNCGFDLLLSCSGVDWKTSLQSVYHLYNTKSHQYLAIKVTAVDERSPSLMPVWPAADWHERETYDLFGICYEGHPNLSRILMPTDWLGHPMRKDYKVDDPRLVWNER